MRDFFVEGRRFGDVVEFERGAELGFELAQIVDLVLGEGTMAKMEDEIAAPPRMQADRAHGAEGRGPEIGIEGQRDMDRAAFKFVHQTRSGGSCCKARECTGQ